MSIWTYSKVATSLALAVVTTACAPVDLFSKTSPTNAETTPPPTQVKLGNGALALAAPDGFCVDRDSLNDRFALLARCDTLGGASVGQPLAIITVAIAERKTTNVPSLRELITENEALLDIRQQDGLQLVSVAGPPPTEGLSGRFWRGAGLVGEQLLALAIYPPAGAPELGNSGADLLSETFRKTASLSQTRPN